MTYALAFLALLLLADTGMTLWALGHGYHEANPLMVWIVAHPIVAVLATLLIIGAECAIVMYLFKNGEYLGAWLAYVVAVGVAIYPIWHNLKQLSKGK